MELSEHAKIFERQCLERFAEVFGKQTDVIFHYVETNDPPRVQARDGGWVVPPHWLYFFSTSDFPKQDSLSRINEVLETYLKHVQDLCRILENPPLRMGSSAFRS